jgi:CRISPR-associated protein Cas1
MLSWPDFEEKQIIYIEPSDIKNLTIKNGNLAVTEEGKLINQVSLARIFAVILVGNGTFTSSLIKKIIGYGAIILLTDLNFKTYCCIGGETEGNTLLRSLQYTDEKQLQKAQWLIENKIQNQKLLLQKRRDLGEEKKKSVQLLKEYEEKVSHSKNAKELLGIEGIASKTFFQAYFGKYKWRGRKPRTKFDEINTVMDIGYTLLFHFIEANLRLYGFDVYKGFYHTEFYQRKSLACDMVEPFRCIIDYTLYQMFALKQFDEKDFEVQKGEYHLKTGCAKKYVQEFLINIMKHKEAIFKYIQEYYHKTMRRKTDFSYFLIDS